MKKIALLLTFILVLTFCFMGCAGNTAKTNAKQGTQKERYIIFVNPLVGNPNGLDYNEGFVKIGKERFDRSLRY